MQHVVCSSFGAPELLELAEDATPPVGPDDVLIEVAAAGVSFVDGLIVSGRYQLRPQLPTGTNNAIAGACPPLVPAPHLTGSGLPAGITGHASTSSCP